MKKFRKLIVTLFVLFQTFVFCAASFAETAIVHKQGYVGSLGFGAALFAAALVAVFMLLRQKIDD